MTLSLPQRISICEVGPRDGLQNEAVQLSIAQKAELIGMAAAAGLRCIEIGSFVSAKAVPSMADTDEVARRIERREGVEYRVLVANLAGLKRCQTAGIDKAKLTVSSSETHSLKNLGRTPHKVMQDFADCAAFAREHHIALAGAISTAFGCPYEGAVSIDRVRALIESFLALGITELSLSDTTGVANPRQVYDYCTTLRAEYPTVQWTLHFHDTRGLGLANVFAGLLAGVTHYDAAFAGLGGCPFAPGATGNIATEDLVHMAEALQIETGVELAKVVGLGCRVQELVGRVTDSAMLRLAAARASHATPDQQQKG
ncbi:MAG: hydroxymethylglutaryl-CoA lyase [Selenomonadales bacterium]|jgi:hydroxymethylglutaryl-CoA lyase|nr:hydroxymethylglutaryl-CoA lyase [Selenomonadales bacterium]